MATDARGPSCLFSVALDLAWLHSALGEREVPVLNLFKKSKYQLVLEFHGDDPENFERVVSLETQLEEALESGKVDGNDVGQGIVNIFIITKDPKTCFQDAMRIVAGSGASPDAAGYRDLDGEDYVRLWPPNDPTLFELK